ncbi:Hypothetical protein precursor [Flavobacterium indicum GPTSA100-9 = DSM 17447]|uniref:YCII-related domain-containing protein n=1 Tax=Flavobacterium indicum (strain DSM 17447 / CIP 109464 / GPTSA100-9) TaxID=1094466 RepID=H8XTM7_FLAIG|nr:YciI family protein [Flavobacterium indicum]CCG53607.1 Hypothetical protein precursor [Flavobacterium indicum GPTSA100-9 = DSM 17447]
MNKTFALTISILSSLTMNAQNKIQFVYEIKLYEQFQHKSRWSEKEHQIQEKHLVYLDSLSKAGTIEMAGIQNQGFADHKGIILLNVNDFEEAKSIALNDPSVKEGMMTMSIYTFTTYYKSNKKK